MSSELRRTMAVPRTEMVDFLRRGQVTDCRRLGDRMDIAVSGHKQAVGPFCSGVAVMFSPDPAGDCPRGVGVTLCPVETYHLALSAPWAPGICVGDWVWVAT